MKLSTNTNKKRNKKTRIKVEKISVKWLEFLWKVAVKCRAGFKSELSGDSECELHPHHIIGKDNLWMRLSLENGICLNGGEHKFMAHGTPSRQLEFKIALETKRGEGIQEKLYSELRWKEGKPNLYEMETALLKIIDPYVVELMNWLIFKSYKSSSVKADYKKLFIKLGVK